MSRTWAFSMAAVFAAVTIAAGAETAKDTDGDGISDRNEEVLGTDPHSPDRLQVVIDEGTESEARRAGRRLRRDQGFHHGRVLPRRRRPLPVAAPRSPPSRDWKTRSSTSTSMPTPTRKPAARAPPGRRAPARNTCSAWSAARGTSGYYDPEGNRASGPPVTHVVRGNTLLVSADVNLGRSAEGVRYALYVLCHTTTDSEESPGMSDSSGKRPVDGVPVSGRKKIMRPGDYTDNFRVAATFGNDLFARRAPLGGDDRRSARPAADRRLRGRPVHFPTLAAPAARGQSRQERGRGHPRPVATTSAS